MGPDDGVGDRQTEAEPWSAPRRVGSVEAVENAIDVLGRDPWAIVGDHDLCDIGAAHHRQVDLPIAVPVGVVDQDSHQASKRVLVTVDDRRPFYPDRQPIV